MVSQRWRKSDVIGEISYSMPVNAPIVPTDETSSGILYSLQWLKGRLRKSREHSIAVVEVTQYQRGDEPLRNLLAYWSMNLAQPPQLKEAAAYNTTNVMLHGQLA